jgi:putative peptidoglycan lipid II flippase
VEGGGSLIRAGRATAVLTGALTIGQLAAIGRDLFVAAQVGLSANLDALLIAATIPIALTGIVVSGPQTALIAALGEVAERSGSRSADWLAGSVLLYTAAAGLLVAVAVVFGAPEIISLVGAGLDAARQADAVAFLRVLALWIAFGSVGAVLSGILQAGGHFRVIAGAWIIGPLASALVTVSLWSRIGLTAYALGMMLGAATTTAALVVLSAVGRHLPRLEVRIDQAEWRLLFRHALPLMGGAAVLQLNPLIQRLVASFLMPGAVSALRYGDLIVRMPLYAAGPAWQAVAYPTLAQTKRRADDELGPTAEAALRYAIAVFIPVAAGIAAFAPLIVDVAYAHGAFDPEDIQLTSLVVMALAPLLLVQAVQPVLLGAHNARHRGMLMGGTSALGVATTAILAIVLGFTVGVVGVALAASLAAVGASATLAMAIGDPAFSRRRVLSKAARVAAISISIAIPAAAIAWSAHSLVAWPGDLAILLVLTGVCAATYVQIAIRGGVDEVDALLQIARRWPNRLQTRRG